MGTCCGSMSWSVSVNLSWEGVVGSCRGYCNMDTSSGVVDNKCRGRVSWKGVVGCSRGERGYKLDS